MPSPADELARIRFEVEALVDTAIRLSARISQLVPDRHPAWDDGAPVLCGQEVLHPLHGAGVVTSVNDDGSVGCKFHNTWLSLAVEELHLVAEVEADG